MLSARKWFTTGLIVFAGALMLPSTSLAANGHGLTSSFGSATSTVANPEPLADPTGIAVNEKTKEIDVIDAGNDRVERFSESGTYQGQFNGEAAPTGVFSSPNAIAVDNDPSSPSYGDIYVSDEGHSVVDKFDPEGKYTGYQLTESTTGVPLKELRGVAVDPSGNLWVAERSEGIDEFDNAPDNKFVENEGTGYGVLPGIAVDSEDDVYLIQAYFHNVWEVVPGVGTLQPAGQGGCGCVTGVGVDPVTNNVYVDRGTAIAEYPPFPIEDSEPEVFGLGYLDEGEGVTVSATHTAYIADSKANDIAVFAEGPKPKQPITETPGTVEGLSAVLKGKLEGGESNYHFTYNANGTCEGGSSTSVVAASGSEEVSVKITGLIAKTKYTACLIGENKYGPEAGVPVTFETTPSVPVVEGTGSSVKKATVSLSASVNPEREAATCVFQYGKSESYGHETPCEEIGGAIGDGTTPVPVSGKLAGLEPNTTYDYRVVAANNTGDQPGPNKTFTTEVITPTQVETAQASDVTATSAVIGGQVNPQGGASYYIEYGSPTCSLNGVPNFAWWLCASKSAEAGPLSGDSLQTVAPIEITGLTAGTTYSYWIVAHNINGSERGEELKFTTPGATTVTPPVVTAPPSIAPPAIVPLPVAPVVPTVSIASASVKGKAVVVSVRTSVSGSVTVTGVGLSKTTKTLAAGTHQVDVLLSKAGRKDTKRHKKITLQVALKAGGKSATASRALKL